jgi:hypothetical protein
MNQAPSGAASSEYAATMGLKFVLMAVSTKMVAPTALGERRFDLGGIPGATRTNWMCWP